MTRCSMRTVLTASALKVLLVLGQFASRTSFFALPPSPLWARCIRIRTIQGSGRAGFVVVVARWTRHPSPPTRLEPHLRLPVHRKSLLPRLSGHVVYVYARYKARDAAGLSSSSHGGLDLQRSSPPLASGAPEVALVLSLARADSLARALHPPSLLSASLRPALDDRSLPNPAVLDGEAGLRPRPRVRRLQQHDVWCQHVARLRSRQHGWTHDGVRGQALAV